MKQYKISYMDKGYIGIVVEGTPFISIREATRFLGYKHAQYTRRLLLEGKLDGAQAEDKTYPFKATRVKEKNFSKWYIAIPSLVHYQASRVVRDTRRRYTLRMDKSNEQEVRSALDSTGITYDLELAYKAGTSKASKTTPRVVEELEEFTFNPK